MTTLHIIGLAFVAFAAGGGVGILFANRAKAAIAADLAALKSRAADLETQLAGKINSKIA